MNEWQQKKNTQNEDERNIKCQEEKSVGDGVKYLIRSIIVAICHMSLSTRFGLPAAFSRGFWLSL